MNAQTLIRTVVTDVLDRLACELLGVLFCQHAYMLLLQSRKENQKNPTAPSGPEEQDSCKTTTRVVSGGIQYPGESVRGTAWGQYYEVFPLKCCAGITTRYSGLQLAQPQLLQAGAQWDACITTQESGNCCSSRPAKVASVRTREWWPGRHCLWPTKPAFIAHRPRRGRAAKTCSWTISRCP